MNSQGRRGACLKASRHQARTPYRYSLAREPSPEPISVQGDLKKHKPCCPLTCPSGKPGKIHSCKQKLQEQQNLPEHPQDTLESGMSQSVRGQPKGRDALAGKTVEQCRGRSLQQEKGIICTEESWSLSPTLAR